MDYNEIEQKKRKALKCVELAAYMIVVVAMGLKVLPILWSALVHILPGR